MRRTMEKWTKCGSGEIFFNFQFTLCADTYVWLMKMRSDFDRCHEKWRRLSMPLTFVWWWVSEIKAPLTQTHSQQILFCIAKYENTSFAGRNRFRWSKLWRESHKSLGCQEFLKWNQCEFLADLNLMWPLIAATISKTTQYPSDKYNIWDCHQIAVVRRQGHPISLVLFPSISCAPSTSYCSQPSWHLRTRFSKKSN